MQEFLNRVIHGDCSEIMGYMPDECVDLTVTSPPYDDMRVYNGYSFPFEKIAKELYRVTKQGGVVVWVVGDKTDKGSETLTSFKQALFFKELGFNVHDTMIYAKSFVPMHDPRNKRYKQAFEYMFVLSKGKPKTYNEIKDKPNKKAGQKAYGTAGRGHGDKMREIKPFIVAPFQARFNIWEYSTGSHTTKDKIAYSHPAIFPEDLAKDHILTWSNEGETVLDCMCGSGTTLKQAYLNNRNFIGIDYSAEYVALSQERLKQFMS